MLTVQLSGMLALETELPIFFYFSLLVDRSTYAGFRYYKINTKKGLKMLQTIKK